MTLLDISSSTFATEGCYDAADSGLLDQLRESLIHRALALEHTAAELRAADLRIAAGTYGQCEECQSQIPAERLRAAPEVRCCVSCQEERESVERGTMREVVRRQRARTWPVNARKIR